MKEVNNVIVLAEILNRCCWDAAPGEGSLAGAGALKKALAQ